MGFLTNHHQMLPRKLKALSREDVEFAFPRWKPTEAQAGWSSLDGASPARAGEAILQRCQGTTRSKAVLQVSQVVHCLSDSQALGWGGKVEIVCVGRISGEGPGIIQGCLSSGPDEEESQGRLRGGGAPGELETWRLQAGSLCFERD